MSESFWVKLAYKEFIGHYCEMTDAEIVADVRKSIGSFSNDRADGDDFGAKMVRKANARMNSEAAGASRANGQKGGRPKKLTAAAATREGVDVVTSSESCCSERTTGCKPLTAEAPHREAGDERQHPSDGELLESGTSANHYYQEATPTSTNEALEQAGEGGVSPEVGCQASLPPSPISKPKTDPKPEKKDKAEPEEQKFPHGEFENVMLTTKEYVQLCERLENADSLITEADQYFEAQPDKKRKYKSHYAMLLNWDRRRKEVEKPSKVRRFQTAADRDREEIQKIADYYAAKNRGEQPPLPKLKMVEAV